MFLVTFVIRRVENFSQVLKNIPTRHFFITFNICYPPSPDVSLLAEEREAGHRHQHRLHVDGPEIHEVDHL